MSDVFGGGGQTLDVYGNNKHGRPRPAHATHDIFSLVEGKDLFVWSTFSLEHKYNRRESMNDVETAHVTECIDALIKSRHLSI